MEYFYSVGLVGEQHSQEYQMLSVSLYKGSGM